MRVRSLLAGLCVLLLLAVYVQPTAAAAPNDSEPMGVPNPVEDQPGSSPRSFVVDLNSSGARAWLPAPYQSHDGRALSWGMLDRATGTWPYVVHEEGDSLRVDSAFGSFLQERLPNTEYVYEPERIKETITIETPASLLDLEWAPEGVIIRMDFWTNLEIREVDGLQLVDDQGAVVWKTEPFVAWDSATTSWRGSPTNESPGSFTVPAPRIFKEPVLRVWYELGTIGMLLNTSMLLEAVFPLYVDPTWTLSAAGGWGSSTFQDAVRDWGDNQVRIGMFADNFDDNTNEAWTIEGGSVTFEDGVVKLATSSRVEAGDAWTDLKYGFKVRFTQSGEAWARFRYVDASNQYFLKVSESGNALVLKKLVSGSISTIASVSQSIALSTDYSARIVAIGDYFEIWWQGTKRWSGTDPSPPPSPFNGPIRLATGSTANANFDNVRTWNTDRGKMTTPVRDAGSYRPLETKINGWVDEYSQAHLEIRSSADNVSWGPWTNLKADVTTGLYYKVPDQDRLRFYQLRVTLTSGVDATPGLSELTTNEGSPTTTPTSTTGYEARYPYVGGLVNAVSGNLWYSTTDVGSRAKGFSLAVERSYNSLRASETGPLGIGWTHAYNQRLTDNGDGTVTWDDPDGSQHIFNSKGTTGGYDAPRGVPVRLEKLGDGTYKLWSPAGSSRHFSSAGLLLSITDRNGNQVTLSYSGGNLASVTDDSGKSLSLSYDGSNRITTVTDPLNRQISYSYDGSGNLVSLTDAMGFVESYSYSAGRLSAIVDPVGKRTAFVYDGSARVTQVWLGLYENDEVVWQFQEYTIAYTSATQRTVTNARGNTATITLNSFGNPTQVSGSPFSCAGACAGHAGTTTMYVWDGESNKIRVQDGLGNAWNQAYDHRSSLLSQTNPEDQSSAAVYFEVVTSSAYLVLRTSATNFRNYTTTYEYDGTGNLVKVTNAKGNSAQYAYDSMGFLTTSIDFRGYGTQYAYNANGWMTQVTNPLGQITSYGYDAAGRRTMVTTHLGRTTTTDYDAKDRTVRVTDPLGNFTDYEYNARGDRTMVTDPNGHNTSFTINVTNRQVQVATDALANPTTYAYDGRVNLISVQNAKGRTTTYAYDEYDRLTQATTPLGYTTAHAYDAAGNRVSRTDANDAVTSYSYDAVNRPTQITYPNSIVTFTYDANGNRLSENGFGVTKTMSYDELDRVVSVTFDYGSFSKTTTYTHDGDGNRLSMRTVGDGEYQTQTLRPVANGNPIQWSRSGCSSNYQCVDETSQDGDSTRVYTNSIGKVDRYALSDPTYWGDGAIDYVRVYTVARHTDTGGGGPPCGRWCPTGGGSGSVYSINLLVDGYPSSAKVLSTSYATHSHTWTTNPATGQPWTYADIVKLDAGVQSADLVSTAKQIRVTQVYVEVRYQAATVYAYDAAARLTQTTDPTGQVFSFGFDADSRRTSLDHPNGVYTTYEYDDADRLTDVITRESDASLLESFAYTYDNAGDRLTMTEAGVGTTTYQYDDLHRVVQEVSPTGWTTSYTYDTVGNRLTKTSGSLTITYYHDADDRLYKETLGPFEFLYFYDNNGNLVAEYDELMNPTNYEYDYENRLTKIIYPQGETCTFAYGPTGERVKGSWWPCTATTYFGYDSQGSGGYEDITAEYDGSGNEQASYTHGPGADEPLAVRRGGSQYSYHHDGLGSVTRMTDGGESTARSYRYDAFGRITSESGSLSNFYAFTSREKHPGSSMYYYRARTYDPDVGRFTGRDPAGMVDGPNVYLYAGNNPVNFVDPSGMHFEGCYGWECRYGPDHGLQGGGGSNPCGTSVGSSSGGTTTAQSGTGLLDRFMCTAGCIADPEGLINAAMLQVPWWQALVMGYSCKSCISLLWTAAWVPAAWGVPGFLVTVLAMCGLCIALLLQASLCIWDCWA